MGSRLMIYDLSPGIPLALSAQPRHNESLDILNIPDPDLHLPDLTHIQMENQLLVRPVPFTEYVLRSMLHVSMILVLFSTRAAAPNMWKCTSVYELDSERLDILGRFSH